MNSKLNNWQNYINSQIEFYNRNSMQKRKDNTFIWNSFNPSYSSFSIMRGKDFLKKLVNYDAERKWFNNFVELLFSTRELLEDEISKLKFDLYIVLKVVGHNKFFYPRTDFTDIITVNSFKNFENNLSDKYGEYSLREFNVSINENSVQNKKVNLITYTEFISLTNLWRQYFLKRENINFIPKSGDVVFDCGACLGDTAMLFLACVGVTGQVHTFDPVPLHNRYIASQAALNPTLKSAIIINQVAVGDYEKKFEGEIEDVKSITAGGLTISNFDMTTIDNYCISNKIDKIDLIKMDIEGAEISALSGAVNIIQKLKPKLAITAYHKDQDLWEIPSLIKKMNPNYKIYFDHHLPITWESCFYAI